MKDRLVSLYVVIVLSGHYTDGCVNFVSSPPTINLASTKVMLVKCSITHTEALNASSITSISIIRSRVNQSSSELVGAIERSKGDKFSSVDGVSHVVTKGYFDVKNVTSLTLLWKRPNVDDVGEYTCLVSGRHQNGTVYNLTEALNVTYEITANMCLKAREIEKMIMESTFSKPEIYKGSYYYMSKLAATKSSDAINVCKGHGGYLVEIDDESELEVALRIAKRHIIPTVLIAGSDAVKEGYWVFPRTGQTVKYFNWDLEEPNNQNNEDCRVIQYGERGDKLNDVSCEGIFSFICEIE